MNGGDWWRQNMSIAYAVESYFGYNANLVRLVEFATHSNHLSTKFSISNGAKCEHTHKRTVRRTPNSCAATVPTCLALNVSGAMSYRLIEKQYRLR